MGLTLIGQAEAVGFAPVLGVLASVPPLPRGPILERLLFENPWPVIALLVIFAVVTLVVANAQGRLKRGAIIAGACVLLAAVAWVIAGQVETTRETLKRRTLELVRAAAAVDVPRLDLLLHDSARMTTAAHPSGVDKDGILRATTQYLDSMYRIREHHVRTLQAVVDGPNVGRTQAQIRVVPELTGTPFISWWRIDWRLDGGVWRAAAIEPLAPPIVTPPRR